MTIPKIKQGEVLKATAFINPGAGAIEFARQYIGPGMDYNEMLEVMSDVIDGNFVEIHDKKVKRCQCCAFYFRDKTKNNSGTTCSKECKAGKDAVLKTYSRRVKSEEAGTARKSYKYGRYAGGEYPFWCNDQAMFEYDRKHKVYAQGDNLEAVVAAAQRRVAMGGRKRNTATDDLTKVNWDVSEYKPSMEFYGDTPATGGKVKVIKRTREEIDAYMLETYGKRKLTEARRRAIQFAKGM